MIFKADSVENTKSFDSLYNIDSFVIDSYSELADRLYDGLDIFTAFVEAQMAECLIKNNKNASQETINEQLCVLNENVFTTILGKLRELFKKFITWVKERFAAIRKWFREHFMKNKSMDSKKDNIKKNFDKITSGGGSSSSGSSASSGSSSTAAKSSAPASYTTIKFERLKTQAMEDARSNFNFEAAIGNLFEASLDAVFDDTDGFGFNFEFDDDDTENDGTLKFKLTGNYAKNWQTYLKNATKLGEKEYTDGLFKKAYNVILKKDISDIHSAEEVKKAMHEFLFDAPIDVDYTSASAKEIVMEACEVNEALKTVSAGMEAMNKKLEAALVKYNSAISKAVSKLDHMEPEQVVALNSTLPGSQDMTAMKIIRLTVSNVSRLISEVSVWYNNLSNGFMSCIQFYNNQCEALVTKVDTAIDKAK